MPAVNIIKNFLPEKSCLLHLDLLADETDKSRNSAALQLLQYVSKAKESEDPNYDSIVKYCNQRLVNGLSSGRKLARVGFSTALTMLLSNLSDIKTSDTLSLIDEKLRTNKSDQSKSEVGGVLLGRAFAYSCLIESGRISKIDASTVEKIVTDLLNIKERKCYLVPICWKVLNGLISQVSEKVFSEAVWPKIRDELKQGWKDCNFQKLCIFFTCKEKFPEIINKKFLKKNWSYPLFSEEFVGHLVQLLSTSNPKANGNEHIHIMTTVIIPAMISSGKTPLDIWKDIGEKLLQQSKKFTDTAFAMTISLIAPEVSTIDQVFEIFTEPTILKNFWKKGENKQFKLLVDKLEERVKVDKRSVFDLAVKIIQTFTYETTVLTNPVKKILEMMDTAETEKLVKRLTGFIHGKDELNIRRDESKDPDELRLIVLHLLHCFTSLPKVPLEIQKSILALFLKLAYFSDVEERNVGRTKTLCRQLFTTSLRKLLITSDHSWTVKCVNYTEVAIHLVEYTETLLNKETVELQQEWPDEVMTEWKNLLFSIKKLNKNKEKSPTTSAFLLLLSHIGLHVLSDHSTYLELLQEVLACKTKSSNERQNKFKDAEPAWIEVLTEVLLNFMSLSNATCRAVAGIAFKLLLDQLTPQAISLITEVLIPKDKTSDDAGGVLVDESDIGEDEEDENMETDDKDEEDNDDEEDDDDEDDDEEDIRVHENTKISMKKALGKAAADSDEEEELSDLSDSEMFKLDEVLADVFRQRMKKKKEALMEKQKEMAEFRIRVLDFVDIIVKSSRCGDFLTQILRPLVLIILSKEGPEAQKLTNISKSIFNFIKPKNLKDIKSASADTRNCFVELLDIAKTASTPEQVKITSTACHLVLCLDSKFTKNTEISESFKHLRENINNALNKNNFKPQWNFFTAMFELDPVMYLCCRDIPLACLEDETTKIQMKSISCSFLTSLLKKVDNVSKDEKAVLENLRQSLLPLVSKMILSVDVEDIKKLLTQSLLSLAIAVLKTSERKTIPIEGSVELTNHLTLLRPKLSTDLRSLCKQLLVILNTQNNRNKSLKRKSEEAETTIQPKSKKNKKSKSE